VGCPWKCRRNSGSSRMLSSLDATPVAALPAGLALIYRLSAH
jgi:hypothetical protein